MNPYLETKNVSQLLVFLLNNPNKFAKLIIEPDKDNPGCVTAKYYDRSKLVQNLRIPVIVNIAEIDDFVSLFQAPQLKGTRFPSLSKGFRFTHPDSEPDDLIDEFYDRKKKPKSERKISKDRK